MQRCVITGIGAISCIGNNIGEITASLRNGHSGIRHDPRFEEFGFRCQVSGSCEIDLAAMIDRRAMRYLTRGSALAYLAAQEAIQAANLPQQTLEGERTAVIVGAAGGGMEDCFETTKLLMDGKARRVSPFATIKMMDSSPSAVISTLFKTKGPSYSISSACATSAHCIGHAVEQLILGKCDVALAGGCEDGHPLIASTFDASGALTRDFNDTPKTASRPYSADRSGFVPSEGGAMVIIETLEHALRRGANIIAEVVGYGASSDGSDMTAASGEGSERCMRLAIADLEAPIDYVNSHGTSTPAGDVVELQAIEKVVQANVPVSSSKALTGHGLGAAGALEAVFSLIMLQEDFILPCHNVETFDPDALATKCTLPTERIDNAGLNVVMSNSFGFGGTNASLVFQRYAD